MTDSAQSSASTLRSIKPKEGFTQLLYSVSQKLDCVHVEISPHVYKYSTGPYMHYNMFGWVGGYRGLCVGRRGRGEGEGGADIDIEAGCIGGEGGRGKVMRILTIRQAV